MRQSFSILLILHSIEPSTTALWFDKLVGNVSIFVSQTQKIGHFHSMASVKGVFDTAVKTLFRTPSYDTFINVPNPQCFRSPWSMCLCHKDAETHFCSPSYTLDRNLTRVWIYHRQRLSYLQTTGCCSQHHRYSHIYPFYCDIPSTMLLTSLPAHLPVKF